MQQVTAAALPVEEILLLLAQSVEMLSWIGFKYDFNLIVISFSMDIPAGIITFILCFKYGNIIAVKGYYPAVPGCACIDTYRHVSVFKDCFLFITLYGETCSFLCRQKRPVLIRQSAVFRGTAADTVRSVWFKYSQFITSFKYDTVFFYSDGHKFSPSGIFW